MNNNYDYNKIFILSIFSLAEIEPRWISFYTHLYMLIIIFFNEQKPQKDNVVPQNGVKIRFYSIFHRFLCQIVTEVQNRDIHSVTWKPAQICSQLISSSCLTTTRLFFHC